MSRGHARNSQSNIEFGPLEFQGNGHVTDVMAEAVDQGFDRVVKMPAMFDFARPAVWFSEIFVGGGRLQ